MRLVVFIGDTRRVLRTFPDPVQEHIGFALYQAQLGDKHIDAKPLKGFGSGVLEVVTDYQGDTFRAVYTVKLKRAVYVLYAFQKKSKAGIATPKRVMENVWQRLQRAIELDRGVEG